MHLLFFFFLQNPGAHHTILLSLAFEGSTYYEIIFGVMLCSKIGIVIECAIVVNSEVRGPPLCPAPL